VTFDPRIAEAVALLPDYLGGHVLVSITALALGLLVALPLAIASTERPRLRSLLLGIASVVQTIPGLALLALFYPLLLALSALTARTLGWEFSALGFLPAVLALALYSVLPVLRNTVTGLASVDPAALEAAQGVGMTPRQSLWMVEVPLALPVIMAGIRTAAVWVIGTATLSTPIGQTSLGNYIFTGLQTQNWVFVLFGCVAAALLALLVDQALALMEAGLATRRRGRVLAGALGLAALVIVAVAPSLARPQASYVIGSKPFVESYTLAALIQQRAQAAGLTVARRDGLGSNVVFDALKNGQIDAYVDYSGTIWATQMGRTDVKSRAEVLAGVKAWLAERGVRMVGALGFENAYALAMRQKRAEELHIASIADLTAHAPQMSIAGDYEFFGRPEWVALRDAYRLQFASQRTMQPEFMYPAAAAGDVDVIAAYTSEGRLAQYNLTVLQDPKQAIPPYDAILLVSPRRANDAKFIAALEPLADTIDLKLMQQANLRASGGGNASPDTIAGWLWEQIEQRKK
jgi:osmoprotectant transport system permease protein